MGVTDQELEELKSLVKKYIDLKTESNAVYHRMLQLQGLVLDAHTKIYRLAPDEELIIQLDSDRYARLTPTFTNDTMSNVVIQDISEA